MSLSRLFRLRNKDAAWPPHVTVGRHTYGLSKRMLVRPSAAAPISLGAFCSVGPEVMIFGQADHPVDLASTFPFRSKMLRPADGVQDAVTRGGVRIGNDVWIGARAIILSGVTVGDGAIIGAGAVVRRDVPPYGIAVGNPAEVVRHRFPPDIVERLRALCWWDWPDDRIKDLEDAFYGPIEAFLARVEARP